MTMALCAGSFDPPTNGHLDLIDRAATMFDEVVVGVVSNPSKSPRLTADRRERLLADLLSDRPNVRTVVFSGLVVELATSVGADVIVKGVRGVSDFDAETQMAHMNRQLSGINTVFLPTSPAVAHISSSLVKEIFALGGSIEGLVPASVTVALEE